MDKLGRIFRVFYEEGFYGIYVRLRAKFLLKTCLYSIDIPSSHESSKYGNGNLIFVPLTDKIMKMMAESYGNELPDAKKKQLVARMEDDFIDKVYVVIDKSDNILGYGCLAFSDYYDPTMNYTFHSAPDDILLFDAYIFEQHRNKGVYSFLTLSLLQEGKRKGFRTASIMIDEGNAPSERVNSKIGFRKLAVIYTFFLPFKKLHLFRKCS